MRVTAIFVLCPLENKRGKCAETQVKDVLSATLHSQRNVFQATRDKAVGSQIWGN